MNIFNLSFGKDSMATLLLAIEQNIPIDKVMYCDIKFSPPPMKSAVNTPSWPNGYQKLKQS